MRIYSNEPRVLNAEFTMHFELNNPLSASISYSNESMKREIWKLNLKACKKIFECSLNNIRKGPQTIFTLPLCNRTERVTTVFLTLSPK